MNWVLDASMTLGWRFQREDKAEALVAQRALNQLLTDPAVVPAIWHTEVAHGLLRGERSRLISSAATNYFLAQLAEAEIETDPEPPKARQATVLAIARNYRLTAYDATYLELAMRKGAALASFDGKLVEAARVAGVRVFGD